MKNLFKKQFLLEISQKVKKIGYCLEIMSFQSIQMHFKLIFYYPWCNAATPIFYKNAKISYLRKILAKNLICKLLRAKKELKGCQNLFMFIQWNLINWPSPPSLWHKWSTNVPHSSWEYSCHLVIYFVCAINNVLP